ncbi:energy transducer TonB [Rhodoferax ferrireducens]|uniref:energy transducer TonB n=1 Tax=Rhodoferax ferrireducens TaxID=192843 RepID=UPI003B3BE39A
MTFTQPLQILPGMNRNVVITLSVVVFHVAALWALQTGLLRRAVELVVPAEILVEFIEPPAPKVVPPLPAPPAPVKQPVAKTPTPVKTVTPQPLAIADPTPSPNAPVGVIEPAPVAPPVAAPVAVAAPAPARVELPSSDADYLQNPKPPYPSMSKRLGEQGKVVVRVLIGLDGTAQKAEIKQSSGFDRLDQSALATVLRWRYVPGKRAGVAEAMWFNVPINFVLE